MSHGFLDEGRCTIIEQVTLNEVQWFSTVVLFLVLNASFLDVFAKLFLQIRKREWPVDGVPLMAKMNMKLQASQAAAAAIILVLKSESDWRPSRSPTDRRSSKSSTQEIVALLLDTADACMASPWRRMKSCEYLFGTLLSGVSKACSSQGNQILRILLLRIKSLVLATCSQVSRSWQPLLC
jgi:phosphatidylinositol 4-kinase